MRTAFLLFFSCCLLLACHSATPKGVSVTDSLATKAVVLPAAADSMLRATGDSILTALQTSNAAQLSGWVHPQRGLHFSPYGFIDTGEGQTLSGTALMQLFGNPKVLNWGSYDGSGDPINLTTADYLGGFVLDRDFKNAPAVSVDSVMGQGNTLLNAKEVYPEARVVEYYFPGTEKPGYMDWKTLRLIFEEDAGGLWLVCIAHDEWTI